MDEKRGFKIYFVHSSKIDYNNIIYLPVARSTILSRHRLVFPDSEENKDRYYKDIMSDCDLFVIELTNPDTTVNLEIKEAVISGKPILALAQNSVGYQEKYQKMIKEVVGYNTPEELCEFVEKFAESYRGRLVSGQKDATMILGVIN